MNLNYKQFLEGKVVILGSTTVGKTSIITRLIRSSYTDNIPPTIGVSFQSKIFHIQENSYKLNIWDTGGSERYRAMAPMYYRDAMAAKIQGKMA